MTLPTRHTRAGFPPSVSPSSHAVESDGWVFLTGQFGRDAICAVCTCSCHSLNESRRIPIY
jgi:enamine deaminase RidA (YjgF/YER057c/UK114 family)